MSPARIAGTFACCAPSRHTVSMASNGLYTRPVMCKFCDKVFDFPTLTTDIAEKDVPVRTRICSNCLWDMGHDEDLRERRAKAEELNRRSIALAAERALPIMNGHKSSLSSIGTNDTSGTDIDMTTAASTDSSNQVPHRVVPRGSEVPAEKRASSEARRSPNVRNILN